MEITQYYSRSKVRGSATRDYKVKWRHLGKKKMFLQKWFRFFFSNDEKNTYSLKHNNVHHVRADVSVLLFREVVSPSDYLQWSVRPDLCIVSVSVLDQQKRLDDQRQIRKANHSILEFTFCSRCPSVVPLLTDKRNVSKDKDARHPSIYKLFCITLSYQPLCTWTHSRHVLFYIKIMFFSISAGNSVLCNPWWVLIQSDGCCVMYLRVFPNLLTDNCIFINRDSFGVCHCSAQYTCSETFSRRRMFTVN